MSRTLSLLVFSLWLGIGIGVSFVAVAHVFSPAVRDSLPPGGSGKIAQGILLKLFQWQVGLAAVAGGLELLARRRREAGGPRWPGRLLPYLLALSLTALFWLHPTMSDWFRDKYREDLPEATRAEAARQFGKWHGISQTGNLLILAGVLACWWNLAQHRALVPLPGGSEPAGKGRSGPAAL
jgi:hypothetical protein